MSHPTTTGRFVALFWTWTSSKSISVAFAASPERPRCYITTAVWKAPLLGLHRTVMVRISLLLLALAVATASAAPPPFYKGMTVSCQTWGIEWQAPEMEKALDELKSLGVNS